MSTPTKKKPSKAPAKPANKAPAKAPTKAPSKKTPVKPANKTGLKKTAGSHVPKVTVSSLQEEMLSQLVTATVEHVKVNPPKQEVEISKAAFAAKGDIFESRQQHIPGVSITAPLPPTAVEVRKPREVPVITQTEDGKISAKSIFGSQRPKVSVSNNFSYR